MLLHECWVLGLSQDHEQVLVGEEVESRENKSLLLEVLVK